MTAKEADPMRPVRPTRDPRADPTRHAFYGGRNKDGSPCDGLVVAGTKTCRMHAGMSTAKLRAKGNVVVELQRWGLDGHAELRDPGETLLRLVTQSAARVELYARLLGEAYEAAERLREASEHPLWRVELAGGEATGPAEEVPDTDDPAIQAARADLERIFTTGGVGALVGVKRDADRFGRVYETEEAIRGLARLEAEERDRCATFATKAIAAGLAERQVRLAESQGAAMYGVFSRVLEGLGLDAGQLALVPALLAREIGALTGRNVIEGEVSR